MTTLPNRPNTALLVVDVQNQVVEGTPGRDTVVPELRPDDTEPLVEKHYGGLLRGRQPGNRAG